MVYKSSRVLGVAGEGGGMVSAKSLTAWEAKMAALPREELSTSLDNMIVLAVAMQGEASMAVVTQGVMTPESEAFLVEVTQGVTIQGAVNEEPAQITVKVPIAKAIKVSVAAVYQMAVQPSSNSL
ncbi:hypothetical protein P692DRAFT_20876404 [Suillus brevipes Sb2]|nr:hypothetical protein P692DRAFT_20876404 [Suillus brevipes Sb2]